jgi:DNA-binding transcriptional regulator YdaS (Cro superfamily)
MLDIIKEAADRAGGVIELARRMGITRQALYTMSRVSAERAVQIERATGIPRARIRPDVFDGQAGE